MKWNDVTLDKFLKLQDILEVNDDWTMSNIIDLLFDVDSVNLSLKEFVKYREMANFLNEEIKPLKRVDDKIKIAGTTYCTNWNLSAVTVAQYIDYNNYCKKEKTAYADLLSVFVIPEGHIYNDGYDINKVKKDMLQLPIDVVYTLAFFFARQFQIFVEIFPTCFKEEIMKMKIDLTEKKKILEQVDKVDWRNLASYHTLPGSVKSSMRAGAQ